MQADTLAIQLTQSVATFGPCARLQHLRHRERTTMRAVNPDWDSEDEDVVRAPTSLPYNTSNQRAFALGEHQLAATSSAVCALTLVDRALVTLRDQPDLKYLPQHMEICLYFEGAEGDDVARALSGSARVSTLRLYGSATLAAAVDWDTSNYVLQTVRAMPEFYHRPRYDDVTFAPIGRTSAAAAAAVRYGRLRALVSVGAPARPYAFLQLYTVLQLNDTLEKYGFKHLQLEDAGSNAYIVVPLSWLRRRIVVQPNFRFAAGANGFRRRWVVNPFPPQLVAARATAKRDVPPAGSAPAAEQPAAGIAPPP